MKPNVYTYLCLTAFVIISQAQGQVISDNFNSYATGANLTTQSGGAWGSSGTYFGVDASGTGTPSSQAADIDVAQNLAFGATTFQTSLAAPSVGESVSMSLDFQFTANDFTGGTARNTISLGFSQSTASNFQLFGQLQRFANTFWNLRANSVSSGQDGVLSSEMGSFAAGGVGTSDWIRMELVVEKSATVNEFLQTVKLYNIGSDGESVPLEISSTNYVTPFTNAALYAATDWYGFMMADRPDDINLTALSYDNFTIVPEPSTTSLVLLASTGLIFLRRKNSKL